MWDSPLELFLLHSPLLEESSLVSFPPLSNMLKSSGWSDGGEVIKIAAEQRQHAKHAMLKSVGMRIAKLFSLSAYTPARKEKLGLFPHSDSTRFRQLSSQSSTFGFHSSRAYATRTGHRAHNCTRGSRETTLTHI